MSIKAYKTYKGILMIAFMIIFTAVLSACDIMKVPDSSSHGTLSEEKNAEGVTVPVEPTPEPVSLINEIGITIEERFLLPEGFVRVHVEQGSFAEYLRGQKLKPHGSNVLYYDGREKVAKGVHEAVLDKSIGDRDLHQCADAIMLLRGEYLYNQGRYDEIVFHFVNGFKTEYKKWMQGYRITVKGNKAAWVKSRQYSDSYEEFRRYMDIVFAYASTLSLEKELVQVNKDNMEIGDVFIKGADPGHAIIVMDMAENPSTGEKLFVVAQSYMPAQETHVLRNPNDENMSPWYSLNYSGTLRTPEWRFEENQLRRFVD
jgi:hypothetical protein